MGGEINMDEDVIETLKAIYKVANDEGFSSEEALDVIMEIVEVQLNQHGVSLENEDSV
jgi:hypothetical protein